MRSTSPIWGSSFIKFIYGVLSITCWRYVPGAIWMIILSSSLEGCIESALSTASWTVLKLSSFFELPT